MNIILIIIILLLLFGGGGGYYYGGPAVGGGIGGVLLVVLTYTCLWEGVKLLFVAPAFYARQRSSPGVGRTTSCGICSGTDARQSGSAGYWFTDGATAQSGNQSGVLSKAGGPLPNRAP